MPPRMRSWPARTRRHPLPLLLVVLGVTGCARADGGAAPPQAGCFQAEAGGLPANTASSVLRITVRHAGGGRSMHGTGFILHGSAADGDTNRILTAVHVVSRALEEPLQAEILIAQADGTPIGLAAIDATAEPWNPIQALDPLWTDQALLRVIRFATPAAEAAFRAAPGLQPEPYQPRDSVIDLHVAGSRGIEPGASGAPILVPGGRVHGVLVQRRLDHWARAGEDEVGAPRFGASRAAAASRRGPPIRDGIAQPLAGSMIPAALGRQAQDIDTVGAMIPPQGLSVLAPAFPARNCVVYRATAGYRQAT